MDRVIKVGRIGIKASLFRKTGFDTKKAHTFYYHPECWEQYQLVGIQSMYEEIKRRTSNITKAKNKLAKGHPRKYSDRLAAQNISANLIYHRKQGHKEEVLKLQKELDKLLISNQVNIDKVTENTTKTPSITTTNPPLYVYKPGVDPMEQYKPKDVSNG